MRILLADSGSAPSAPGEGPDLAALARALTERAHTVALASPSPEAAGDGATAFEPLPGRRPGAGIAGPLRDVASLAQVSAFGALLDRMRPDVVHLHRLAGLSPLLWREAARRRLPLVQSLHDEAALCPQGRACARPCLACRLATSLHRALSRSVDAVVGTSRHTLARHLDRGWFPTAAAAVLPGAFAPLAWRPRRRPPSGTPLRLGFVGRLSPGEGAAILVEAVRALPARGWTLDILATGPLAMGPLAAGPQDGAPAPVRFLAPCPPDAFFAEIDLLVVPPTAPTGFPQAIAEAFARSIPVVGSDAGAVPEQIDEGRTGWLVRSGSAADLARVLAARLADRQDLALAERAFADRVARLDGRRVAAEYVSVYEAAAARRAGHAAHIARVSTA